MGVIHVSISMLSQKVFPKNPPMASAKKRKKKKETLASVFRVQQLKRGKLSAFTNYRKVIEVR